MGSAPETELWVVCPVCNKPNPSGTRFCQHCWGAVIHSDIPVSTEELENVLRRRQAYLKRKRLIKLISFSLASLIILVAAAYPVLYYFTDSFFAPPQGLNSNSSPGEWAMFRHDLGHSGATGSSSVLPQGSLKWTFSTDAPIHSSPAVAYGTVYFGSRDFKFYALDAATGTKRWEYEVDSWVESSPTVANGVVYFGSNDGWLHALDAHSGEKLWDFKTRFPVASSAAVAGDIVYFGADDYYIYALNAADGTKLWDFNTKGILKSSPVVSNGIVYTGSAGGFSYALHALDGRLRLRYKTRYPVFSSPVVSDDTVYFINDNGDLYAVDGKARNWPQEYEIRPHWLQLYVFGLPIPIPPPPPPSGFLWGLRLRASSSSPVLTADSLYAGADNKLMAVDLEGRQIRWEFEADGTIRSSPAVAGNTIYFGSDKGRLYAVDATSGEKLWDIPLGEKITSSPAVADGTIYIGSHDGNLYAIK